MRQPLFAATLIALAAPAATFAAPAPHHTEHAHDHAGHAATAPQAIAAAVADSRRKPANRARDVYRHPAETLAFFGIKPTDTVVEIWPGGGWYAEILAPLLRDKGRYIAAAQPPGKYRQATETLLASDPARFDKTVLTTFAPGTASEIAPAGTADAVLTFRNVHNMLMDGEDAAARAFADFHRALKPGGVLGIVDHRLPEAADPALERSSGYIKRSTVIRLAQKAGFALAGESAINANPKDSANWPKGVWTLPPTLALKDTDRAKYTAIGESDRMTLKFVKR